MKYCLVHILLDSPFLDSIPKILGRKITRDWIYSWDIIIYIYISLYIKILDPIIASLLYIKILSYKILESQNWKTQPFLGPVARSQRLQPVAGGRLAAVLGVAPDHHAAVGENRREGPVGRLDLLHVLQQVLGKTPKKDQKSRKTSGEAQNIW